MRGGSGHGPYWYLYRRKGDGRLTSTYVGKKLPGSETSTTDRAPPPTERPDQRAEPEQQQLR